MALNWVMLTKEGDPVPLQDEKTFLHVPEVKITLTATPITSSPPSSPTTPSGTPSSRSCKGSLRVTSHRVIFLSSSITTLNGSTSSTSTVTSWISSLSLSSSTPVLDQADMINNLSVPIDKFQDCRFIQPWMEANYCEAVVVPVPEGGLQGLHQLKITFHQGSFWEFYKVIEEVKKLHEESNPNHINFTGENLPAYEPPPSPTPPSGSSGPSLVGPSVPRRSNTRSSIDDADIEAAIVARQEENKETVNDQRRNFDSDDVAPPGYRP